MFEAKIKELELQLATAHASIAVLTTSNEELARDLAIAETRTKKLNRSAWHSGPAPRLSPAPTDPAPAVGLLVASA